MENCLVTKLKGTVNNDNLHRLGLIDLPVSIVDGIGTATGNTLDFFFEGGDGNIDGATSGTIAGYTYKGISGSTGKVFIEKYKKSKISIRPGVSPDGLDIEYMNGWVDMINFNTINLVKGDLIDYKGWIQFQSGSPTGAVSNLQKYVNAEGLTTAYITGNWDWNIYPNIKNLPNLQVLATGTGDQYINWDRPSNYPIICMVGAGGKPGFLHDVAADAYLNNMAQCQPGSNTEYRAIYIQSRTAASDAAVATLQEKGYTVRLRDGVVTV